MKQPKITVEQFKNLTQSGKTTRRNKYRNVETAGYDSKKEYHRSLHLKELLAKGLISNLKEQQAFLLVPAQIDDEGKMVPPVSYIADFVYTDITTGKTIVEDVKGKRTEVYRIKKKLMLERHNITVKEV